MTFCKISNLIISKALVSKSTNWYSVCICSRMITFLSIVSHVNVFGPKYKLEFLEIFIAQMLSLNIVIELISCNLVFAFHSCSSWVLFHFFFCLLNFISSSWPFELSNCLYAALIIFWICAIESPNFWFILFYPIFHRFCPNSINLSRVLSNT